MAKPRILFMGTPAFALPSLKILHEQKYPIIGVVSQPDRPQGRGLKEIAPPVKILAQEIGLPVFQPKKSKGRVFSGKRFISSTRHGRGSGFRPDSAQRNY